MFGRRYFGGAFFGARFFGEGGNAPPVVSAGHAWLRTYLQAKYAEDFAKAEKLRQKQVELIAKVRAAEKIKPAPPARAAEAAAAPTPKVAPKRAPPAGLDRILERLTLSPPPPVIELPPPTDYSDLQAIEAAMRTSRAAVKLSPREEEELLNLARQLNL